MQEEGGGGRENSSTGLYITYVRKKYINATINISLYLEKYLKSACRGGHWNGYTLWIVKW